MRTIKMLKSKSGWMRVSMLRQSIGLISVVLTLIVPRSIIAQTMRVPVQNIPSKLDPAEVRDVSTALVAGQVFDNLYEYTAENNLTSNLIISHVISPDAKTIKLKMRENRFFSDGSQVTVKDVVTSLLKTILIMGERCRWAFGEVEGFDDYINGNSPELVGLRILSDFEFEVCLARAFPKFLQVLTAPYFGIYKEVKNKKVGSGTYVVESSDQRSLMLLKRDDIRQYPQAPRRILFFRTNGRDESYKLAAAKMIDLSELPVDAKEIPVGYDLVRFDYLQSIVLLLNTKAEGLRSKEQRCDFGISFREGVSKSQYDWRPIYFGLPFSRDIYEPLSEGKVRSKSYRKQHYTVLFSDSSAGFSSEVNKKILTYLHERGFDVTFKRVPIGLLVDRLTAGTFEAALTGYVPDYLDPSALISPFVQSDQQYNHTGYSNEIVDKLIDLSHSISDKRSRYIIFKEIFGLLARDCPVIFLGSEQGMYIVSRKWEFPSPSGMGFHSSKFRNVKFKGDK